MGIFNNKTKGYNFSKIDKKEQDLLTAFLTKIETLINSRALLYEPDKKRVIIRGGGVCYGNEDPTKITNPTEGQIYFHIQDDD